MWGVNRVEGGASYSLDSTRDRLFQLIVCISLISLTIALVCLSDRQLSWCASNSIGDVNCVWMQIVFVDYKVLPPPSPPPPLAAAAAAARAWKEMSIRIFHPYPICIISELEQTSAFHVNSICVCRHTCISSGCRPKSGLMYVQDLLAEL